MTTLGGARQRHRARQVASLLLLAVGWMAIVATSPPVPKDTLSADMRFSSEAIKGGDTELIAGVNAAAISDQHPVEPLRVDLSVLIPKSANFRKAPSVSLIPATGEVLRLHPSPPEGELETFALSWTPGTCPEACIHSARLIVEDTRDLPPSTTWVMSAEIVYQRGKDSVPENAGLVLGLREDETADLLTSNTPPGDLLPSRGVLLSSAHPYAHQTVELEVPRSAIPSDHIADSGEANLVWRGGALRILAASTETTGRVMVKPTGVDQVDVAVEGTVDLVDGTGGIAFEVPFVVLCGQDLCVTDMEVDFELVEGAWLVLDWSNNVPGIRTEEGDIWVQGPWHLRLVEP